MLEEVEESSTETINRPLPWDVRDFRPASIRQSFPPSADKDLRPIPQRISFEALKTQNIPPRPQNTSLKSVIPQKYSPSLLQWPKSELLVPKGIKHNYK